MTDSQIARADTERKAAYQELWQALQPLYRRLGETGRPPSVRQGWQEVAHIAHGWFMVCQGGAEALIVLDANGFSVQAFPICRTIIEHIVALQWVVEEGDKIHTTLASGHEYQAQKQLEAAMAAGWAIDDAQAKEAIASAQAARTNNSNDFLLAFEPRLAKYGDDHLRVEYNTTVAHAHATFESAAPYFVADGAGSGSLVDQPRQTIDLVSIATIHLFYALGTIAEILYPKPWGVELAYARKRIEEISDHNRAARGLRPVDWATGELIGPAIGRRRHANGSAP